MGQVCSNLPSNIVGPFKQTLFLGCTVKSFTSTVGWNEQETNVTVELIEDTCAPAAGSTKHYYPRPGISSLWNAADPGFQSPTVGAPVYFRVEDFEFAGVIQSWSRKDDSSNFPSYSVTISDPRFLLENLTIITGEYAGEVKNVPNLVNAYGWLESISGDVCQLDAGLDCRPCTLASGEFPHSSTEVRPLLGSPADGFGGANENNEGVPWLRLKEAIQILLSGNTHTKYSPKGYAVFRGHSPTGIPSPANGMGRIEADDFDAQIISDYNGNGYTTNYIVDIDEIPFSPIHYRIGATDQSLLSLISQVCADAGCDFYIELILTGSLDKVIKVRTVKRRSQPDLGEIETFLNNNNDYLISKNVGRELRNEPTSVFLYGANVESIYEVVPTGAGGSLNIDQWLPNNWHEIPVTQHWGFDSKGQFQDVTYFTGTRNGSVISEWDIDTDILGLQQQLAKPLVNLLGVAKTNAVITETEFRAAMTSFDTWYNYTLFAGITGGAGYEATLYDSNIGTAFGNLIKQSNNFGTGLQPGGIKTKLSTEHPSALASHTVPNQINLSVGSFRAPNSQKKKDLEKMHSFIKAIADENYGKKFVVKVPEICYYKDHQSDNYIFSDSPSNAGYPSSGVSGVLGIPIASKDIEKFEEEDTAKIRGIARYFFDSVTDPEILKTGAYEIKGSEFVKIQDRLYCPMSVENKVYLFPTGTAPNTGVIPAVIVDIKTSVFTGDPKLPTNQGAYSLNTAGGSAASSPEVKVKGDILGTTLATAMSFMPHSYTPSGMAIPMKSNTQRYGPWGYVGPAGPVRFAEDTDLAPWNYQGYDIMNSGAIEKVVDGLTFMQAGERGGFTLVGYPVKQLGQDLRSPNKSFSSLVLEDKTTNYGTYKYISTTPMDGSFGPNITSINVSIGEGGATTTYELATFTPSFGRMSKINANRLKEVAKQRAENKKSKREIEKLISLTKKGGGVGFSAIIGLIKDQVEGFIGGDNKNQAKNLMIGASSTLSGGDSDDNDLPIAASSDSSIVANRSDIRDEAFSKTAIMSQEGMFRPVSKSGDGDLPGFTPNTNVVAGNESHSQCPMGPIDEWTRPIVNCSYLDPMTSSGQDKHCVDADNEAYHDILQVGFGDSIDQSGGYGTTDLREFISRGNDCPEDFRFLATKGPMVINGWGYDLQGKPIPNEADNVSSARNGIYTSENLTDQFMSGWLKKSKTWPVAPVDLRFDRSRGVWTVPNNFRIVQIHNTGASAITQGGSGFTKVLNPSTLYGSGGSAISTQSISLSVPSWFSSPFETGQKAYAFYDTSDSKWYPIPEGSGSGSSSNQYISHVNTCSGDPTSTVSGELFNHIAFGTGLMVTGADLLYQINTTHSITDAKYCDESPNVVDAVFDHLIMGEGLDVTNKTGCSYSISANHSVNDKVYCDYDEPTVVNKFFTKLSFGQGLRVVDDDLDDPKCEFTINADHLINDTAYCDYTPSVANKFFRKLTFGRGLQVTDDDGDDPKCEYTINADQRIKSVAGQCDEPVPTNIANYKQYSKIIFDRGLKVTQVVENCEYVVSVEETKIGVSGVGTNGIMGTLRDLRIGSGLGIIADGSNPCKFTIVGSGTSGCQSSVVGLGGISVTTGIRPDGCLEYSVSGGGGSGACTGTGVSTFSFVSAICCSGSGLDVKYSTAVFQGGCFSGLSQTGVCT